MRERLQPPIETPDVAVIGGGPAGLIAAEVTSAAGLAVTVYEHMPSFGRKLLMAGRGGLNLTHSEPFEPFVARYGAAAGRLRPYLEAFPPAALVAWAEGLGQETFVGSSGRVFPKTLKASPLLRAWLARLERQGVTLVARREWLGWDGEGALVFRDEAGERRLVRPRATVLALGGASWPRLGSNGRWAGVLADAGVSVRPFRPANSGFTAGWSEPFRQRFAGAPLKTMALSFAGRTVRGEATITAYGVEGGAVYALSAALRDAIERTGRAVLEVDLRPDLTAARLAERLARSRGGQSLSTFLRKAAGLSPVAVGLLREAFGADLPVEAAALAAALKAAPVTLTGVQGLERAISTAGGVDLGAVDDTLGLRARPGVHVAGEMLDWEAPTGGYLLQASFATGVAAGDAVVRSLVRA
jgi:hypothetical protein